MKVAWIVFALVGLGLVVLLGAGDEREVMGMTSDQLSRVIFYLPILAMLAAGILASRQHWLRSIRQLLIWFVIILAVATLSLFRDEARRTGERLLAGLLPGRAITISSAGGTQEVLLSRDLSGHFTAVVTVNAQDIPMLVDTGASAVTLTYEDAVRVGIIPENLSYSRRVMTANGEATAAPIDLTIMALGPIARENVPALVTRRGALDQSLLGMSFLRTLSSFHMQADELRLKD